MLHCVTRCHILLHELHEWKTIVLHDVVSAEVHMMHLEKEHVFVLCSLTTL